MHRFSMLIALLSFPIVPFAYCLLPIFICGCQSAIFGNLFSEQDWSENYALEENVQCSSDLMIDGDVNTMGVIADRDMFIALGEKRVVHRVALRNTNVKDLVVYASTGEGLWKRVGKLSNNQRSTIDMRLSAVATDKFRFTVMGTNEDQRVRGEYSLETGKISGYIRRASTKIGELELYGFAPKVSEKTEEAEHGK